MAKFITARICLSRQFPSAPPAKQPGLTLRAAAHSRRRHREQRRRATDAVIPAGRAARRASRAPASRRRCHPHAVAAAAQASACRYPPPSAHPRAAADLLRTQADPGGNDDRGCAGSFHGSTPSSRQTASRYPRARDPQQRPVPRPGSTHPASRQSNRGGRVEPRPRPSNRQSRLRIVGVCARALCDSRSERHRGVPILARYRSGPRARPPSLTRHPGVHATQAASAQRCRAVSAERAGTRLR